MSQNDHNHHVHESAEKTEGRVVSHLNGGSLNGDAPLIKEEIIISPGAGSGSGDSRNSFDKFGKFLPISILIAAVLIGGSVVFSALYTTHFAGMGNNGGNGSAPSAAAAGSGNSGSGSAITPPTASTTAVMTLGPRDAILGNKDAKVTLIEYGDYQCPFCARFFQDSESQIISNYVNTGKVRMVFRNFPFLGSESVAAAEAAECANDQGKLWAYHDALYTAKLNDEANGGGEDDGFYSRTEFLKLAGQVGLNVASFTSCIDSNKYSTLVNQELQDGAAAGVQATPSFFINGSKIEGAQPYSVFQQAIEAALKG